jgi:hypothetical protein
MRNQHRSVTGSFAPKGHNEIAQGRAQRHPGWYATPIRQSPERAKHHRTTYAPPVPPFQGSRFYYVTKPRAALRFALGYPLAPRWGFVPLGIYAWANIHSSDSKKTVGCLAPKGHKTIGKRQSREPTDNYNFVE